MDLIETARKIKRTLPPVKYVFFNTGLEMRATKEHIEATKQKYGIEIEEVRPKISIVTAVRRYGVPFISKVVSQRLSEWQAHDCIVPLTLADEFEREADKQAKLQELYEQYKNQKAVLHFILSRDCNCNVQHNQLAISNTPYLRDFLIKNPPRFRISAECCRYCKKAPAHMIERQYEMKITGERRSEGGQRSIINKGCFVDNGKQPVLRPLYYVSDKDKEWYKQIAGIRYSDAYEVYGMKRTGCCGCPISYRAVDDLELIKPFEPNLVKAAWHVFGDSYRYRQQYVEYKKRRMAEEKAAASQLPGQLRLDDIGV